MIQGDRKPVKRLPSGVVLFLFSLSVYLFTMGGRLYSPDCEIMFRTTESIVERFETSIEPLEGFATRQGVNGREYAQYGIAQSVLAVPLYLAGKALSAVVGEQFLHTLRLDTIQYYPLTLSAYTKRFGVSFYNLFVTALTVALVFALTRRIYKSEKVGIICALLYGVGTVALPQSKPFYSEGTAALFLLLCFFIQCRGNLNTWDFLFAGCGMGMAILTRVDSVVAFPALGFFSLYRAFDGVWHRRAALGKGLIRLLAFALPVILAVVFIAGYNNYRFGSVAATGYEDQDEGIQFGTPILVGLYGQLFSAGKGLFIYSPVLVLLLWAVPRFVRKFPLEGLIILGVSLAYILVMSKWLNWAGGWCWGPRHIFQVNCFLIIPLGILFHKTSTTSVSELSHDPHERLWRLLPKIGYTLLFGCALLLNGLGVSASYMDALQPMSEYQRYMTLWIPNFTLPVLYWELIDVGRTDIWWVYFLRAPLGWWRLLALIPPAGIVVFGLAVLRRLRNPEETTCNLSREEAS